MTEEQHINLMKTLCAMRWIALMKCDLALAQAVQQNIETVEELEPCTP